MFNFQSQSKVSAKCMLIRGGTSKGVFFLSEDLPSNIIDRNNFLLKIMGSPDINQINGVGGGNSLTSKVAIIKKSKRIGIDIDYLFLQVSVDQAIISDVQNCGNILAGVGPFALERKLLKTNNKIIDISIYMENTNQIAVERVVLNNGKVKYNGDTSIDGVPGTGSAILINFKNIEGSTCGSLLPTGNIVDIIDDIKVTCIDNGMPVVILLASDLNIKGTETKKELENNFDLCSRLEKIRLQAGKMMNLNNVINKTIPKMTIVSPAKAKGTLLTRTFIPHRCHTSIGVFGAISVATACMLTNSIAFITANIPDGINKIISIEHLTGKLDVAVKCSANENIKNIAVIRTAKKIFDGEVFV